MSGHRRVECVCGNRLSNCRCSDHDKPTEIKSLCECAKPATGRAVPELLDAFRAAAQRYNHVVEELARRNVAARAVLLRSRTPAGDPYDTLQPVGLEGRPLDGR